MPHSVETFPGDVVQLDFQNTGRRQTAQISWHIMCYKLWLKKVSTQKHQGRRQSYEQMASFISQKPIIQNQRIVETHKSQNKVSSKRNKNQKHTAG